MTLSLIWPYMLVINFFACISKILMVLCVIRIVLSIVYFDFRAESIYLQ